MQTLKPGVGGRGTSMTVDESKPHPASHYEVKRMEIEKAKSGGFSIRHHMGLKKRHMGKPGYEQDYEARNPDPEMHVAGNMAELKAHMEKHMGGGKMAEGEGNDSDNAEMGEPDGDE